MRPRHNFRANTAKIFALRAIGVVLLARWLDVMSQMSFALILTNVISSPLAYLYIILLFLLIIQPGVQAQVSQSFHLFPQLLRQTLYCFSLICFLFNVWLIGQFIHATGLKLALHAAADSRGWFIISPGLYIIVMSICRARVI